MSHGLKSRFRDDSGVMLVMAVGIAVIGIAVAMIVVSVTITSANDSGRDRLRTTEIHSAEAALDATFAEMEVSSPCSVPSFAPDGTVNYGKGNTETIVTVTIEYFDDAGAPMTDCTGLVIDGIPKQAVVTASSVSANPSSVVGLKLERTIQSRVNLEPRFSVTPDAAIYSASVLTSGTNFDLTGGGDIWIENGDWFCGNGTTTNGSVFIPDGSMYFEGGANSDPCYVGGSLWVQNDLSVKKVRADGYAVGKSLTIRSGNAGEGASQNDFWVGDDVRVGGIAKVTIHAPTVRTGLTAAQIKDLPSQPLPKVTDAYFDSPDFTVKDEAGFKADVEDGGGKFTSKSGVCTLSGVFTISSLQPVTYDLRSCAEVQFKGATFTLGTNVALLGNIFTATGTGINFKGDGTPRKLWVVIPYADSATCVDKAGAPYTIYANNTVTFLDGDVSSFWYTPGQLHLATNTDFNGQVYGGCVVVQPGGDFNYQQVGVPGFLTGQSSTLDQGFNVEIVYKREVS